MAGWLLIPDAPQLMFWLWSIYLMIIIIQNSNTSSTRRNILLLLGFTIGCCIYSKVSGVFLWFGFLLYLLFYYRQLFKSIWLYVSGSISILFVAIILYWNLTNHFVSYTYHSERVSFFTGLHLDGFFRELIGEAIYNNPISFCIIIASLIAFLKGRFRFSPIGRLLLLNSVPLISIVIFISLFRDTLPHWTGPAYSTLILFAAVWLGEKKTKITRGIPGIVKASLLFTSILLVLAIFLLHWSDLSIGNKSTEHLGKGDVTLDLSGFRQFGHGFDSLYRLDEKQNIMKPGAFLLSDYWFPAAHLDYYVARPNGISFLAIAGLTSIHHYAWLNQLRPFLHKGDDAYLVIVSNYFNVPDANLVQQFSSMSPPVIIPQMRGQTAVRNFYIYRLKDYRGNLNRSGVR
jgi:hypothetical protein